MADDIVVLSDSDEDNVNSACSRGSTPTLVNFVHQQKNQHVKRKLQQQQTLDDEAPASKKPTYFSEGAAKSAEQRANCGTPKLPQIVAVETLATPSATPPLQLLASPPRNTSTPKHIDMPKSSKESLRRVKLTTVLKGSDDAWQELRQKRQQTAGSLDLKIPAEINDVDAVMPPAHTNLIQSAPGKASGTKTETKVTEAKDVAKTPTLKEKSPLEKEYEELIAVCRKADPSADMQKLVDTKLLKYYHGVHPDFIKSRGFRKTCCSCIDRIRAEPDLVYYHLKTVVDELNVRRKSKEVIITNEEASPAGSNGVTGATPVLNKHTEEQIKKLNKALYVLKKRILRLEEADVDLEDENSSYLQMERYKKRACQIYEKICDLTGESKHARRLVKKPIQFSGTNYPTFNKTLQAYINRTKEFPDFFDVLRMMEHCNRQYNMKLANFEMKRIAQDAFQKVGKLLQTRRKTDLYEMVSHFTSDLEDPAKSDPDLMAKLNENQKAHTRINEVLETYARAQDDPDALEHLRKVSEDSPNDLKENGQDDAHQAVKENSKLENNNLASDEDTDDEDDDEEELDVQVEKLTKDNTIDLSDEEVEMEISHVPTAPDKAVNEIKAEGKDNTDLKLTENNNIMRTKTTNSECETKASAATEEVTNNVEDKKASKTTSVAVVTKDVVIIKTAAAEIEMCATSKDSVSVKTSTAKIPAPSKNAFVDPKLLRTIAEIVISDEE